MGRCILLFLLVLASGLAELTPADRVYIDTTQQKTVAQVNANINTQVNKINEDLQTNFASAKEELHKEIRGEFSRTLKSVGIGLAGVMIVVLCLFRILEMRLNHNKLINNYENELKGLIEDNKKFRKELEDYRNRYITGNMVHQPIVQTETKKKSPRKILILLSILLIVVVIGVLGYKLVI